MKQIINDKINAFDEKLNPSIGVLLKRIFKAITLILILVVLPVISLTIGALAVGGTTFTLTAFLAGFLPWITLVLITGALWFYFSRWTVAEEEQNE